MLIGGMGQGYDDKKKLYVEGEFEKGKRATVEGSNKGKKNTSFSVHLLTEEQSLCLKKKYFFVG